MSLLQETLKATESLQLEPSVSQNIVFTQLLNKLGDNNPRVREKADEILLQMAQHKCFGPERVTTNLIKGQTQSGPGGAKKPV